IDLLFSTVAIDFLVLSAPELDTVAVVEVGHNSPRSLAHEVTLLRQHTKIRRAFLEFDCIASAEHCRVDQFFGDLNIAVMVDPDLRDDVNGITFADWPAGDLKSLWHQHPSGSLGESYRSVP